jgi:hypothetical protein
MSTFELDERRKVATQGFEIHPLIAIRWITLPTNLEDTPSEFQNRHLIERRHHPGSCGGSHCLCVARLRGIGIGPGSQSKGNVDKPIVPINELGDLVRGVSCEVSRCR